MADLIMRKVTDPNFEHCAKTIRMRAWATQERKRTAPVECVAELYVGHPEVAKQWPFDMERAVGVGTRGWPLPNVWLGVTAVRQPELNERVPELLMTPATIRFVSAEPLLGQLDFTAIRYKDEDADIRLNALTGEAWVENSDSASAYTDTADGNTSLDWIIVGESGSNARPMHRQWARSIQDQCQAAGVAFFHKQNGERIDADEWLDGIDRGPSQLLLHGEPWKPTRPLNYEDAARLAAFTNRKTFEHQSDGTTLIRVGRDAAGRLLDGRDWNEMPEVRR